MLFIVTVVALSASLRVASIAQNSKEAPANNQNYITHAVDKDIDIDDVSKPGRLLDHLIHIKRGNN